MAAVQLYAVHTHIKHKGPAQKYHSIVSHITLFQLTQLQVSISVSTDRTMPLNSFSVEWLDSEV